VITGTLCAALYSGDVAAAAGRAGGDGSSCAGGSAVEDPAKAMADTVSRSPIFSCVRGSRAILSGVSLEVSRGRDRRAHGTLRIWQDDDPCGDRRPRALSVRRIDVDGVTLTGGTDMPAATLRAPAAQGGMVFPVPLPVRAPVGDRERLPRAGARATASRRIAPQARGLELLRGFGVDHRAGGAAAASCRGARRSGSRSRGRWRWIRRCCCWTSRPHRSIPSAAASSDAAAGPAAPAAHAGRLDPRRRLRARLRERASSDSVTGVVV